MKLLHAKKITISILALGLLFPAAELSNEVKFSAAGLDLYNVKKGRDARGRDTYSVADLSYRDRSVPSISDLVLSFNTPAQELARDDSGKYTVRSASYETVRGGEALGGGAASFFKGSHGVVIETARDLWLGRCTDLESFTVELRLFPVSLRDGGVLFSNISYSGGKKTGIELLVKGGRVAARFFRLFKDPDGRRVDIFLNHGRALAEGRWHHYSVSFDRITGKLASFTDGEEDEVVYATAGGEPLDGVFEPSFGCEELPAAVIGRNYYGYIDELRVSYRHIEDLKRETALAVKNYETTGIINRVPVNREGVITSPVYDFPLTGTRVIKFEWEENLGKDTFVWMEFRISDDLFDGGGALKWYRVANGQRNIYLMKAGDLYLRGKYYQWRAHLLPSPDGKRSPVLSGVRLNYQLDPAPRAPLFPECARTGDERFVIRWKKNVEHDILGYRLYYGIRPRSYDGILGTVGGKRISNQMNPGRNYIEVEISNDVVEENRKVDSRRMLGYPVVKNNVLYYIAVSAYDSYRPDTPYNHESEPSAEITARPFAGSEITR